jgi:hypothetical protein
MYILAKNIISFLKLIWPFLDTIKYIPPPSNKSYARLRIEEMRYQLFCDIYLPVGFMILDGFPKLLCLDIVQKSFAKTAILCMSNGKIGRALTCQLYIAGYIYYYYYYYYYY